MELGKPHTNYIKQILKLFMLDMTNYIKAMMEAIIGILLQMEKPMEVR